MDCRICTLNGNVLILALSAHSTQTLNSQPQETPQETSAFPSLSTGTDTYRDEAKLPGMEKVKYSGSQASKNPDCSLYSNPYSLIEST